MALPIAVSVAVSVAVSLSVSISLTVAFSFFVAPFRLTVIKFKKKIKKLTVAIKRTWETEREDGGTMTKEREGSKGRARNRKTLQYR